MGKVVEVTAQGYEQRASAPAAAWCRTLTRRFAPPSPASRRGDGNVQAPTNAQEQASASFEDRKPHAPAETARAGLAASAPLIHRGHIFGHDRPQVGGRYPAPNGST